jgi:hypothetical protein
LLVGPLLTFSLSRVLGRFSNSAAALIASRRMNATPGATFRSVSGLVVAVFVVTVFAGSANSVADDAIVNYRPGYLPSDALVALLGGNDPSDRRRTCGRPWPSKPPSRSWRCSAW